MRGKKNVFGVALTSRGGRATQTHRQTGVVTGRVAVGGWIGMGGEGGELPVLVN